MGIPRLAPKEWIQDNKEEINMGELIRPSQLKTYTVTFEENGGEYTGFMFITTPHEIEKIDGETIRVGNTSITMDEPIIDIMEGMQELRGGRRY